MASNENEMGVKAVFDITDFKANTKEFDRQMKEADKRIASIINAQKERAKAAESAAKATAAAEEKAAAATEKSYRAQQTAHDKMIDNFKKFPVAVGIIVAAIVIAYRKIEDEARRLGDADTIAGFDAMNEAVTNLGDSLSAMAFEATGIGDILKFMASGVVALTQVLTISGAAVTWFVNLFVGTLEIINRRLAEMKQGKVFTSGMDIGREFSDLNARANQAANQVILASVGAPENVRLTKQAEADAKARQKQLDDEKATNEKYRQQIADFYGKIADLQIESGEDILAAEADLHAKSASAWASYIEKTQDIIAEGVKKRAELLSAYQGAVRSAEADYQRESETASYNHGKKLADIARDYQNAVRQINKTYGEESLDAARNLDAVAFVRAKEKRDSSLQDAERNRDQANADENENYSRQLYELQRSLEDKKREAEDAYRRGLEEQRRAEQDAQNSAKVAYNKQLSDAKNAFAARLAAIQASYINEDAAARAHYLSQETLLTQHLLAMQALMAQYNIGAAAPSAPAPRRRAAGGLDMVSSPTPFVAGEAGPEMVLTMPLNRAVNVPMIQTVNHTGDFTHQIDSTIRSSVAGIDGRITAAVAKVLYEVLG